MPRRPSTWELPTVTSPLPPAEKGIPVEPIGCDGCLSERVSPHCVDCRHGFRRCAAEKKVTWCFECPEFP
ncbi:MAG: DUF3795 domain-containing protein [Deltaproteobacteria bacterium]|nr:DUF3795 domain-containing protein [Deltaproteobacteria bacterium]